MIPFIDGSEKYKTLTMKEFKTFAPETHKIMLERITGMDDKVIF